MFSFKLSVDEFIEEDEKVTPLTVPQSDRYISARLFFVSC